MQTNLADFIKNTAEGQEADEILRSCVHCGFCLAVCPTYQLLGDELDSPRGRIYLMKQVLEGAPVTEKTQLHLDRCLTCRACETVCPSGVHYGRLVDIGRGIVEKKVGRRLVDGSMRYALRQTLARPGVVGALMKLGRFTRPLLPGGLKNSVSLLKHETSSRESGAAWPPLRHNRRMLVLEGCVQPALAPQINASAARVFDRLGISLIKAPDAGCCGALAYHLNAQQEGMDYMRRNVDAWWPYVQPGGQVEAIVMTASGCGVTVKEYGHLLRHDTAYAEKAARISELTRDISEVLEAEAQKLALLLDSLPKRKKGVRLAFHSPCTLQHGMRIRGVVEKILVSAGFQLTDVPDAHLCCGSAGTYSILQPELSQQLLKNKVTALQSGDPERIATANIGCLMHIRSGAKLPVAHWIEILDEKLGDMEEQAHNRA
ncbi:glycolate oxidase subunit GlcF [Nitrosospira sp. Is2]|uniref:glycolate oxidase subunit GlcF n=1 Tax=Nitrosospira sp. Is2 TaxID=3080532 RepID=UPI002954AD05|nr:glycolate oxidase subunit GlcF [Nitrosospira sp. Is2]WON72535.1 glycolate oxidase subunit GlcF [Nitrosospira sp. Is2]